MRVRRERRVRAVARTMLEEEVAARKQLPAGPDRSTWARPAARMPLLEKCRRRSRMARSAERWRWRRDR